MILLICQRRKHQKITPGGEKISENHYPIYTFDRRIELLHRRDERTRGTHGVAIIFSSESLKRTYFQTKRLFVPRITRAKKAEASARYASP